MAIHPTAIVDRRAELDPTVEVGPYCVIDGDVRIEAGTRLYHHVYVTGWTQIGPECTLHPGVVVGHEPQDLKYSGERTFCRVGARTVLREYVTVHRGTTPESETVIGDDCFLLAVAHVAHNCRLGNRVTMVNNAMLAGHVEVGDRVMIGGGAGIHQFVRIGTLVMVQGNAGIAMDVPPFMIVDSEGRIAGINRIGLRRAEFTREEIAELHDAHRLLYRSGLLFRRAVDELAGVVRTRPGRELLNFVQAESRRGFAPGRRSGRTTPDAGSEPGS